MKPIPIELCTPLSVEECLARLRRVVDGDGWLAWFSWKAQLALAGRVDKNGVWLRKKISYRNSFQQYFKGTLRAEGNQTVLSGQFAIHPAVRLFMVIWFVFVGFAAVGSLVAGIYAFVSGSLHSGQKPWLSIFISIVLPLFGFALLKLGSFLSRNEPAFIKDLLMKTLEAKERAPEL